MIIELALSSPCKISLTSMIALTRQFKIVLPMPEGCGKRSTLRRCKRRLKRIGKEFVNTNLVVSQTSSNLGSLIEVSKTVSNQLRTRLEGPKPVRKIIRTIVRTAVQDRSFHQRSSNIKLRRISASNAVTQVINLATALAGLTPIV